MLSKKGGTYAGVAVNALLINAKVMDNTGSGQEDWIISGIQWSVLNESANVISMSFASNDPVDDGSDPISQAVDWATNQGVICCAAAGNNGPYYGSVASPGCAKTAITVGACDDSGNLASFSSLGPTSDYRIKPDVVAPGVNIVAARASGTSLGDPVDQYYTRLSGTSMATPHVAGAAALILQAHPNWTPQKVKTALIESANLTFLQPNNDVLAVGGGIVNIANAITVSTFASNSSVSFSTNSTSTTTTLTSSLTFSSSVSSASVQAGKCESSLPPPLTYDNGKVTFTCPVKTTSEWCAWLNVAGGSEFSGHISIPLMAIAQYVPPTVSTWSATETLATPTICSSTFTINEDKLYVADTYVTGLICEYSLPSLTLLRNVTLPDTMIDTLVASDGYLYAGTDYGYLFKISLSTFTVTNQIELPGNPSVTTLLMWNSNLYATTLNGTLREINPITFSVTSSNYIDNQILSGTIADSRLYYLTWTGHLWQIDPSTLQGQEANLGQTGFEVNSLIAANGNLYAAGNSLVIPSSTQQLFPRLYKLTYSMNIVAQEYLGLPTYDNVMLTYSSNELYVLSDLGYPQFGYEKASVTRIDLTNFTADATLNTYVTGKQSYFGPLDLAGPPREGIIAWCNYIILGFEQSNIVLTNDNTPNFSLPTCISSNVNSTEENQPSQISSLWYSKTGLSGFIAGSNATGQWVNQTWTPLTGNLATATYEATLSGAGNTVMWESWCNDTNDGWTSTDTQAFIVTASPYYTLTILPSEGASTNPVAGTYSYPSQTLVPVTANFSSGYEFAYWLLDSESEAANPVVVNMNQNHTLQAVASKTNATVMWENLSQLTTDVSYSPISTYTEYACSFEYAQTFTVGDMPHSVSWINLYMEVEGTPSGPIDVSIMATQNGLPYGPSLANGTVDASSLPRNTPEMLAWFTGWVTVNMTYPSTPLVLAPFTQYAVVVTDSNDNNSNCMFWGIEKLSTPFNGGDFFRLNPQTTSWQSIGDADELWENDDALFQIWGTINTNSQYYLTVISPYGSTSGSGWYSSGSTAQASISPTIVSGGPGIQHVFAGWTGDASGSDPTSNIIIMNSSKIATALWKTQYQLTFAATPSGGGTTSPSGDNIWVNSGPLSISIIPNSGYRFSHWTTSTTSITFDNSTATSTTAEVNGPGTITASLTPTQTSPPPNTSTTQQTGSTSSSSSSSTSSHSTPKPTPTTSPSPTPTPLVVELPVALFATAVIILATSAVLLILRKKGE